MVGLVALLVVGPERLPRLARTAGLWIGRGRRMLTSVKAEIDRELRADELKQILEKQARSNPLETILEVPKDRPGAAARPQSGPTDAGSGTKQGSRSE